ncbi:MAG TPA: hypothetical protein VNP92_25105 [Actinophytocola sp.]|nr:hypothetical protein [Actinophytocola sp.]
MTQPYGQPGDVQPGGNYPGSGGFPQQQPGGNYPGQQQPGGNYPGSGGFPAAPGYQQNMGGMPQAPQEYSAGPMTRPGVVTAAAVLAYIQAGITAITTILVFAGAANMSGGDAALQLLIGAVQAVGVVLLIMGGVQIMGGKSRTLLVAGTVLELVICLFYGIFYATIDVDAVNTSAIDVSGAKAVLVGFAVAFAVMPVISLALALGNQATQFLRSRRG